MNGNVNVAIKATISDIETTRLPNDGLAKSIQTISVGSDPISEHVVNDP